MFGTTRPAFGSGSNQLFGSNTSSFGTQQQPNTTPAFGSNQSSGFQQGFGGFRTNNTGVTNTTGMFGVNNASNMGGSSLFGGSNLNRTGTTSMFGNTANSNTFGAVNPNANTGTAIKPFTPYQEKDPTTNTLNTFESITFMPEYRNFSFEELRLQDYRANRRYATSQPMGSNMSTFGQGTTNTMNTGFGVNNTSSGGLFGQTSTTGFGSSPFGNTSNTNNAFSSTNISNPFGTSSQGNTGGLFGQRTNTATGAFGQQPNTGGLFGQPQQQNSGSSLFGNRTNTGNAFGSGSAFGTGGGGLFGNTAAGGTTFGSNTGSTGGLFGQKPNQPAGSGLFGNKPSGGPFGTQQTNNSLFGANNNTSTGGIFGQNANTTNTSSSLFGQQNNRPFGTAAGSSVFGNQQNVASPFGQTQPSGGLFGNANTSGTTGGLFGQKTQPFQSTATSFGNKPAGGGLFGQSTQQQQPTSSLFGQNTQQQTGGLFGSKPAGTTSGSGLFGNQQQSGGLFGSKPTGLFGSSSTGTTNNTGTWGNSSTVGGNTQSGGLFNNKPSVTFGGTTGGLFGSNNSNTSNFGSTNTGGGSLFGSNTNTSSGLGGSGSLFGNKPAGALGTLGSTGGGLFGARNTQQGQTFGSQQPLGAANNIQQPVVANNDIYGTNNLFTKILSNSGAVTQNRKLTEPKLSADLKGKVSLVNAYKKAPKPLFTNDASTLHSETNPKVISKVTSDIQKRPVSSTFTDGSSKSLDGVGLYTATEKALDDILLDSKNLLFNPERRSFKTLIQHRRGVSEEPNKLHVSPVVVEQTSEKDIESKDGQIHENIEQQQPAVPAPVRLEVSDHDVTEGEVRMERPAGVTSDDFSFVGENYYISPSLDTLSSMTLLGLRKVENLIVGHKLFGRIEFLQPVDLSNTPLPKLCGDIIQFEPKHCILYSGVAEKPEPGSALNVSARITNFACYPVDKATRAPIKDPSHQLVKRHIESLKKVPYTRFEKYDPQTGNYTFVVTNTVPSE